MKQRTISVLTLLLVLTIPHEAYSIKVQKNAVWKYQGCYKDYTTGDKHILRANLTSTTLSAEDCISRCAENKNSVCGIGDGGKFCFGDTFPGEFWNQRGRVGDENCQRPCVLSDGAMKTSPLQCGGDINGEPTVSLYLVGIGNQRFTYQGNITNTPEDVSTNAISTQINYFGCYYSQRNGEGGNFTLNYNILTNVSPESCIFTCKARNFDLCGIDFGGRYCLGFNSAQVKNDLLSRKVAGDQCNAPCSVNSTLTPVCGGLNQDGYKMSLIGLGSYTGSDFRVEAAPTLDFDSLTPVPRPTNTKPPVIIFPVTDPNQKKSGSVAGNLIGNSPFPNSNTNTTNGNSNIAKSDDSSSVNTILIVIGVLATATVVLMTILSIICIRRRMKKRRAISAITTLDASTKGKEFLAVSETKSDIEARTLSYRVSYLSESDMKSVQPSTTDRRTKRNSAESIRNSGLSLLHFTPVNASTSSLIKIINKMPLPATPVISNSNPSKQTSGSSSLRSPVRANAVQFQWSTSPLAFNGEKIRVNRVVRDRSSSRLTDVSTQSSVDSEVVKFGTLASTYVGQEESQIKKEVKLPAATFPRITGKSIIQKRLARESDASILDDKFNRTSLPVLSANLTSPTTADSPVDGMVKPTLLMKAVTKSQGLVIDTNSKESE
ncbi:hypothetical protein HK098_005726 [Nowakowskiella sp. JEL0407]|nr:hypothetical protein HK098_005726 [Nowakowskiella sp. JEL0407]